MIDLNVWCGAGSVPKTTALGNKYVDVQMYMLWKHAWDGNLPLKACTTTLNIVHPGVHVTSTPKDVQCGRGRCLCAAGALLGAG